jgi:arsenate reductase
VLYLKDKPSRETLEALVAKLEDPVADLVRKDSLFARLGLDPADYTEPGPVVDLLLKKPALLQRPVVVKGERAIVGRPKERVRELLTA